MRRRVFRIRSSVVEESVIVCAKDALRESACRGRAMVFTDSNVYALYRDTIERYFPGAPVHVMPAGEEHKTQDTLFALLGAMAAAELHRGDTLVCVGGGVTGDVGGLAAALYMRGIAFVQVPTTLLAQVDSSVGGKTAIDLNGVKNLVGAFRQPRRVLVDGRFLDTLPAREIRCGLGEIVKHGALCAPLFDTLWEGRDRLFDRTFLRTVVTANIAFKADVVRRDPDEKGLRKCLNLGHTTAHAFELCDAKLSHGEYVLVGMLFEGELARLHAPDCDHAFLERLRTLIVRVLGGVPQLPPAAEAAAFARLDKKNRSGDRIALTAPVKQGGYALLELDYGAYLRELTQIEARLREEIC